MNAIKLMIADDHRIFSEALITVMQDIDDIKIVGVAENGRELLQLIKDNKPDVVVLDVNMPEMDGIECCKEIKDYDASIKVVILSSFVSDEFVLNALHNGADSYLSKCSTIETLKEAILQVIEGKQHKASAFNTINTDDSFDLTQREKEILTLIGQGLTAKEIANQLSLSQHTIEQHRKNLRNKLKLKNQSMLVKYAIERGLV